ncbi:unnamed protein product [Rotaria sordida]|uniref:PDZ domain-containing protein n=2 Tax=Rotaria sordida TaxID=392033 RepID=A0A819E8Z7_9BILA|nr:unnamed protein product [Rotaria sordida]CAF4042168.1 unnamed protein product [Rotaria sordida]
MTTRLHTVVLHKRSDQNNFGIYFGDDIPSGVYVITIEPNSPAADANIQPGDSVLAVNGQLISELSKNPREVISEIAKHTQTLTLTIQSSNILQVIDELSTNDFYNNYYQYPTNQSQDIDRNCESFVTELFCNENLKTSPVSPWNNDENILMPDRHSVQSRHRHRKGKHYKTQASQTLTDDELDDHIQTSSARRIVPSMGTSQVIRRNSQLPRRSNETNESQENSSLSTSESTINHPQLRRDEIVHYSQVSSGEREQTTLKSNKISPSINNEGLRVIYLYRLPNFSGFGFSVRFHKGYYRIYHIETNSPAQYGGLHEDDIIRKVNNQTIETISYQKFLQFMKQNNEVILVVQNFNDYVRINPEILRHESTKSKSDATSTNSKIDQGERKSVLSNLFTKLSKS